jgi:hypothetical protein
MVPWLPDARRNQRVDHLGRRAHLTGGPPAT